MLERIEHYNVLGDRSGLGNRNGLGDCDMLGDRNGLGHHDSTYARAHLCTTQHRVV